VASCLRDQHSLFDGASKFWTKTVVDETAQRLLIDDTRELDFQTKLRDQLDGLPDEAITSTAERLYIHVLPIHNMGLAAKRGLVEEALPWRRNPARAA
jgi:hypothetical protein